ncbi:MAG: beta-1,6-N-acetylglucosaminyltransferase [Bacteroides sp.]|nr:beta-1,6-N-acetylglucosaminyltransferase [Bacteroides sp.]
MKHAFLIIAHNEYAVLTTLLTMLDDERNDIYVHVDRRSRLLLQKIRSYQTVKSKLYILPNPIRVYWGDISIVKTEFILMEYALRNGPYSYYHLLSGVDLPIQSQNYIHDFFARNAGKEFVGYWQSSDHQKDLDRKVSRYYLFTKSLRPNDRWHSFTVPFYNFALILQKIAHFRRKKEIGFKKGPQWFSITQEFCQHLIKEKAFVLKRFRYTLCPDEIFVQTILWNSPFRKNIYCLEDCDRGDMRLIDWGRGAPYVWQKQDAEEIIHSDKLFARKFSSNQKYIINQIKELYTN